MDLMDSGEIDLVVNVPREYDEYGRPDECLIRRRAVTGRGRPRSVGA